VKTIALILLLTCFGAWAQSPPGTDADSSRDAILLRALHDAEVQAATNSAVSNTKPVTADTNSVPAASDLAAQRRRRRRDASAAATNVSPVTVVNASNAVVVNAGTNTVVVTAATNPVVVAVPSVVPAAVAAPANPAAFPTAGAAAVPPPGAPVTIPRSVPTALPAPGGPPGFPQPRMAAMPAPAAAPAEPIVKAGEIDFSQATVDQLLDFYALLVNRSILKAPNLPQAQINFRTQTDLTKSEAVQACKSILAMNNISVINVGEKFVKAVPVAIVGTLGVEFSTNDLKDLPEEDSYVTQIVHIQNAKPSELIPILAPYAQVLNNILAVDSSGMLIIRDYAVNVKRMMELIKQVDVVTPLEYETRVIPIKYAKASDISSALASIGGNTAATIGPSPAAGGTGARPGGFTPGGAATGTLGGGTGYPTPGAVNNSPAGQAGNPRSSSFNDRLKALGLKSAGGGASDFNILGATKIIADERTNSLLVFASKQDMAMITNIIAKLDTVLAQVLIDAIVMEVTLDKSQNVGVSYNQVTPSTPGNYFSGIGALNNGNFLNPSSFAGSGTNGLGGLPSGFSYLASFGNDFDATITAIATDSRIHVLSRPRIQTSHAVPASLKIGDTVPYVTGTYFGGINGQASSQYQQTFVGIDLEVTPLINSEGLVVMDISEDIQQLGTPTIIDGNPVPTTTERSASAKVSVRDRDTIILGGFISTTKSRSKSGIPLLKDVPGLGYLFRSTADSFERVELVILIRPTVLFTPEQAALVATHERNKLPNVKRAFAEDQEDENRQLKAADRIKVPPERD
jgi:general secretion pathway protein D